MPEVVPSKVISFTSEDKAFPASNLLKGSSFSKWRCLSGGSKQEAVELSFSEPIEISRIDIGNNGSAFIEVLVRRSAASENPSVLLPSSSFMSPVDAKNETNLNRVRVFSGDQFTKSVASQKWDIVKFVCSQPLTKLCNMNKEIKVDSIFNNEDADSPQFKPGSLFQASRQTSCSQEDSEAKSSVSGKLIAVKHSTNITANINTSNPVHLNRPNHTPKTSNSLHLPQPPPSSSRTDTKRSQQPLCISNDATASKAPKPSHSSSQKPLSNVIFTLSGYQNPLRSQIRDKAIELGAKYRQDWGPDCTHLICAFPNTPKFNIVKGKGIIVSDKWITQCYETKSSTPWRSYRVGRAPSPPDTTPLQSASNESEDNESQSSPSRSTECEAATSLRIRGKRNAGDDMDWEPNSSDENQDDDDDEVVEWDEEEEGNDEEDSSDEFNGRKKRRRITGNISTKRHRSTVNKGPKTKGAVTSTVPVNNPEEEDTDDEIQRVLTTSRSQLADSDDDDNENILQSSVKSLPDIFMDKHFFIHNKSIPKDEERLLERLIVAFAGNLHQYMSNEVQYVITRSDWDSEFDTALSSNGNLLFIRPEWIFACDQHGEWMAYESYQVKLGEH
ncbi:unnamed protein product [Heterobilharzia americana]|nr:unnamed protein product [Heterobilharzia americana]